MCIRDSGYEINRHVESNEDVVGLGDFLGDNKLILNLEQLLKIFYFYENLPFNVVEEHDLYYRYLDDCEYQLDVLQEFYKHYVEPNYEKYHADTMTREQHLAKVAHNFNMWEKCIEIEYDNFPILLQKLQDTPLDMPVWIALNVINEKSLYKDCLLYTSDAADE